MEAPKQLLTNHNLLNVNEDVSQTSKTKCFIADHVFEEQHDDRYVSYRVAVFYPQEHYWYVPVENVTQIADYLKSNNINVKIQE
jgi:hypothetical protein